MIHDLLGHISSFPISLLNLNILLWAQYSIFNGGWQHSKNRLDTLHTYILVFPSKYHPQLLEIWTFSVHSTHGAIHGGHSQISVFSCISMNMTGTTDEKDKSMATLSAYQESHSHLRRSCFRKCRITGSLPHTPKPRLLVSCLPLSVTT